MSADDQEVKLERNRGTRRSNGRGRCSWLLAGRHRRIRTDRLGSVEGKATMRDILLAAVAFLIATSGAANADKKRVDICHVPPGNPAKARTISVAPSAVEKHLAHGDNLGACCPCWVRGDRPGGIDFEAQELEEGLCKVGPAGAVVAAFRSDESLGNSWGAQATDMCVLVDEASEIDQAVENLSNEESAACLRTLLESQMWLLNCES
jgi:hypothetical protein